MNNPAATDTVAPATDYTIRACSNVQSAPSRACGRSFTSGSGFIPRSFAWLPMLVAACCHAQSASSGRRRFVSSQGYAVIGGVPQADVTNMISAMAERAQCGQS